jgi:hypothetical protein
MQGFCAETGGAITLFMRDVARHPGLDDAHDHRCDRRRWRGKARLGGALGRRRLDRDSPGSITMPAAGLISALAYFLSACS